MNAATETASPLSSPPATSTTPALQPDVPVARTRFSTARPVLFVLLALAALAWCVHYGLHLYRYETTDDAYVTGHLHQISSQLDGQVKEVLVQDNQPVRAGDVLLRLDPLEFQIALQKAESGLALARAQEAQTSAAASQAIATLEEAKARVAQAEAQLAQTDAQLTLAQLTLGRSEQLFSHGNAATQADVDNARSAAQAAQAANRAAQANLVAARATVGSAEAAQASVRAQAIAATANTAAAEASRREAERKLALTNITAPSAGRTGNKHVETGDRVLAGQLVLALAEPEPWIIANFKETQLARMSVGQSVDLTIDAVPGIALHGQIDSLSPASGAQFALLPADNSTGNFNKVVQRVPVKITLDAESRRQLGDRLRLGLSAVVGVRVR
jgi:membrane fusion protein (multidrug efflux system)